jgi:hypothetical protein
MTCSVSTQLALITTPACPTRLMWGGSVLWLDLVFAVVKHDSWGFHACVNTGTLSASVLNVEVTSLPAEVAVPVGLYCTNPARPSAPWQWQVLSGRPHAGVVTELRVLHQPWSASLPRPLWILWERRDPQASLPEPFPHPSHPARSWDDGEP